jgi:Ca-activated chloride channel family protein
MMGSLGELHFLRPGWLTALALLVPMLWVGIRSQRSAGAWRKVCDAHLLRHLVTHGGGHAHHWPLATLALGWIATCLALAGPAWERLPQPAFKAPVQRVFVLNLSPSMDAGDVAPSRLARARYELSDALAALGDGQAGLVIFAEEPYVVTPLSDDPKVVASFLPILETSLMPGRGSRVDRAIDEARKLLEQAAAGDGEIVLLTDGAGDRPEATIAAARNAAQAGYPVSVLGIGTAEGAPIPGSRGFVRDARGQATLARLDASALQAVANAGDGRFALHSPGDDDIRSVLNLSAAPVAPGREIVETEHIVDSWKDRGIALVWVVALLAPLAFRRGWATTFALGALLGAGGVSPEPAHASVRDWMWRADQLGAEAFEQGRHAEAAELFEDPAWRATSLYREGRFDEAASVLAASEALEDQYNLGNALAHAGRLDEAVSAYDQVLSAQPEHADAKHNRDLVAKLLEQQQEEQPSQQQQADQDSANGSPSDSSKGSEGESGDGEQQDASSGSDGAGQQAEPEASSEDDSSSSDTDGAGEQDDAPGSEADTESDSEQTDADPAGSGSRDPGDAAGEDSEEGSGLAEEERDGAGRVADPQHADTGPPGAGDEPPRGPASSLASQPLSEQEQAVEQWLSRVSDDPGGLLREKLRRRYAQKRFLESMRGRTR